MRVHELLNTNPLVGMLEATTSGAEGTEAARKPYKPYRTCKTRKPRKPYTTEESASGQNSPIATAIAAKSIIVEAAARPYQPDSTTDSKSLRFRDFLLRVAALHHANEAKSLVTAMPKAKQPNLE